LQGLNVTIPHKQDVMGYLDTSSLAATAIGAVNTLYLRDERLLGENTDAPGFIADLSRIMDQRPRPRLYQEKRSQSQALVLGAGGSARAVVYALLMEGWPVTVAARRLEQADELVAGFQTSANNVKSVFNGQITAIELRPSSISRLKSKITLVVNTTPVGMWPHIDASPWPAGLALPDGALIYDLIYNPAETVLLQAARSSGLSASNGLGMLIEQAALALELWTGHKVPRLPMWQAVTEYNLERTIQGDGI